MRSLVITHIKTLSRRAIYGDASDTCGFNSRNYRRLERRSGLSIVATIDALPGCARIVISHLQQHSSVADNHDDGGIRCHGTIA